MSISLSFWLIWCCRCYFCWCARINICLSCLIHAWIVSNFVEDQWFMSSQRWHIWSIIENADAIYCFFPCVSAGLSLNAIYCVYMSCIMAYAYLFANNNEINHEKKNLRSSFTRHSSMKIGTRRRKRRRYFFHFISRHSSANSHVFERSYDEYHVTYAELKYRGKAFLIRIMHMTLADSTLFYIAFVCLCAERPFSVFGKWTAFSVHSITYYMYMWAWSIKHWAHFAIPLKFYMWLLLFGFVFFLFCGTKL